MLCIQFLIINLSLGFTGANYAYVISKVKDLPKLHRAVWKGNMTKVKSITKGIRKKDLNATDKAKRYSVCVLFIYM